MVLNFLKCHFFYHNEDKSMESSQSFLICIPQTSTYAKYSDQIPKVQQHTCMLQSAPADRSNPTQDLAPLANATWRGMVFCTFLMLTSTPASKMICRSKVSNKVIMSCNICPIILTFRALALDSNDTRMQLNQQRIERYTK